MIYYVELGVQFTNDYGDINESFYNSMESMYFNVTKKVGADETRGLFNLYRDRLKAVVTHTENIGWGFHDQLAGMYEEVEGEYEEEEVP